MTDLALSIQNNNASQALRPLTEIAAALGVPYGRLRGFAESPGVAAFVGAVDVPGVKGVRYHVEAIDWFRHLIEAQDAGLVTPKTAAAWLAQVDVSGTPSERNGAAIVPLPQLGSNAGSAEIATVLTEKGGEAIDLLRRLVEAVEARQQPEDRWIGAEEAMALLHCSRRALGRRVKPVMPGTWSLVQIQAFMRRKREGGKP